MALQQRWGFKICSNIQFDWLKDNTLGLGCQKKDAADVAERLKPVYNAVIIPRRIQIAFCF